MLRALPRLVVLPLFALLGHAQDAPSSWKLPPPEVVRMLDAPPTPTLETSPDGATLLFVERPSMPSLAEVARAWLPLAGLRIDARRNAPQLGGTITGLVARRLEGGEDVRLKLPEGGQVLDLSWSPAGRFLALSIAFDDRVELWIGDTRGGGVEKLASQLNPVLGRAVQWMPDGLSLLVLMVPVERGAAPAEGELPAGPSAQDTTGAKTSLRTYTDLLKSELGARQFEYYATSQLWKLHALLGTATKLGASGLITGVDASPDGAHVLVTTLHRPFSYVLPESLFPHKVELWSTKDGALEKLVVDVPLGDAIPPEGVRKGPRDFEWQESTGATLWWCEAQDGGDPRAKSEQRDQWFAWPAPFGAPPAAQFRLQHRAQGLTWFQGGRHVLAREYDRDKRWTKSWFFELGGTAAGKLVEDRSVNDRYGDPGALVLRRMKDGTQLVRQDGPWCYRRGEGASSEGARPFLDRVKLADGTTERLWQCEKQTYETVVTLLASSETAKPRIVTSLESPTEPPNYRLRDLEAGTQRALSTFPDPAPELRGVKQELVKYKRADGVDLSGTLYLPKGYVQGTRLPLVVWAYPLEYSDASTAGQVTSSPWRFVRVRGPSQLFFLSQGYAVLDNATMPIVGEPETMNDTFLEQIVAASKAAIDKLNDMGVADPERVGVGGHSYGAFMTANLLAHCDLYRAGIARSGAYNRTLTPFGFQSERRTLWEAPQSYLTLSPFLAADKIDEPLLLIHGEKDNNLGTAPIQSERLFQALQGNGRTARLVVLPSEAHGYRSRECVLQTLAEMFEWFDKYVKNAPPRVKARPASAPAAGGR